VSSEFLRQSDEEVAKEGVELEDWSDDKIILKLQGS